MALRRNFYKHMNNIIFYDPLAKVVPQIGCDRAQFGDVWLAYSPHDLR